MKNKTKLGICSMLIVSSLIGTMDLEVHASSAGVNNNIAQQVDSSFKDVETNSSAYEAINWAKNKGIISGYTDSTGKPTGMFGPNNTVTEAQFVKIVAEYLGLKDYKGDLVKTSKSPLWSDTYYDAFASYGVPVNGYYNNTIRNSPI